MRVSGEESMRAITLSSLVNKLEISVAEVLEVRRRLFVRLFLTLSLISSGSEKMNMCFEAATTMIRALYFLWVQSKKNRRYELLLKRVNALAEVLQARECSSANSLNIT